MQPRWDDAPLPELPIQIRAVPLTRHSPEGPPLPVSRTYTDEDQRRAIRLVLETIAEDPAKPWTVEELARVAQFSKFHFTRIFLRHVGVSPHRYLMRYRAELAKELLERTPHYVSYIATALGYVSIGTFSSRFTSDVGCSPTMYRRLAAHAIELSEEAEPWCRPRALDRDAARLGVSLDPRDLPQFRISVGDLMRQLDTVMNHRRPH